MATKTKKKNVSSKMGWEIGGAVTAAAIAAAAGAYLLSDKKTKTKAKKWVLDVRKEMAKKVKTARKVGAKEYAFMVDQAIKRYGSMENLSAADMIMAAKELKGEWDNIQQEAKKIAKKHFPAAKKKAVSKGKKKSASKSVHSKKSRR